MIARTSPRLIALALLLGGCASTSMEQRGSGLITPEEMAEIGAAAFNQLKSKGRLSADFAALSHARCIVDQLSSQLPTELAAQRWETVVFDTESSNLFALPGGKIGIHIAWFRVVDSESQVAAAIAHELAHLSLGHTQRRVSDAFAVEAAIAAAQTFRGDQGPQPSRALYALLGLGVQVDMDLPYSSAQEAAADAVTLKLLAQSGYDPQAAIGLWQTLAVHQAEAPVPWLLTHPDTDRHISESRRSLAAQTIEFQAAGAAGQHPSCQP